MVAGDDRRAGRRARCPGPRPAAGRSASATGPRTTYLSSQYSTGVLPASPALAAPATRTVGMSLRSANGTPQRTPANEAVAVSRFSTARGRRRRGREECARCQRVAPGAGGGTTGSTRPTTRSPATSTRASASTCSTCSAAGGIAAYLQPSADLNPMTCTTTLPGPADRPALRRPRPPRRPPASYLAQLAEDAEPDTGRPSRTAGHDRTSTPSGRRSSPASTPRSTRPPRPGRPPRTCDRPAAAGAPPGTDGTEPPAADGAPPAVGRRLLRRHASSRPRSRRAVAARRAGHLRRRPAGRADDDEGYTPPPPPPLPRISKYAVLGVLGIVVGFVLFLLPDLLPVDPRPGHAVRLHRRSWPASSR